MPDMPILSPFFCCLSVCHLKISKLASCKHSFSKSNLGWKTGFYYIFKSLEFRFFFGSLGVEEKIVCSSLVDFQIWRSRCAVWPLFINCVFNVNLITLLVLIKQVSDRWFNLISVHNYSDSYLKSTPTPSHAPVSWRGLCVQMLKRDGSRGVSF